MASATRHRRRVINRESQVSGLPLLEPFGVWLADQLEERGWNQTEFAEKSGIPEGNVGTWLRRKRPSAERCVDIATALGVPVWRVLEVAGYPWDGMVGVPNDDVRREIMLRLELATPEVRELIRDVLKEQAGT